MTHTEVRTETVEWEDELCDNCNHLTSYHFDEPKMTDHPSYRVAGEEGVKTPKNYTQHGCMFPVFKMEGGRKLPDNPHPRCPCMELV